MPRQFTANPIFRGDTAQVAWEFTDYDNVAIPISGDSVVVVFKTHVDAVSNLHLATITNHFDAANGKGNYDVPKAVTATFPQGLIHMECTWVRADGSRVTFFSGPVEILEPGNKP